MKMKLGLLWGLLLSSCAFASVGSERLMLFGGNGYPGKSVDIFCEWAGGKQAALLLIHWAGDKDADYTGYESAFHDCIGKEIQAPPSQVVAKNLNQLERELREATAVFFTGGDQTHIMDVLNAHPKIAEQMRLMYRNGILFGGTSAGTAIMSKTMLTGVGPLNTINEDKVETAPGLGLLDIAVVDQHFFDDLRIARMFSVLKKKIDTLGVGVDEGAGISIEQNRYLTVLGGLAMAFHYDKDPKDGSYRILEPHDGFDLVERRRLVRSMK